MKSVRFCFETILQPDFNLYTSPHQGNKFKNFIQAKNETNDSCFLDWFDLC